MEGPEKKITHFENSIQHVFAKLSVYGSLCKRQHSLKLYLFFPNVLLYCHFRVSFMGGWLVGICYSVKKGQGVKIYQNLHDIIVE